MAKWKRKRVLAALLVLCGLLSGCAGSVSSLVQEAGVSVPVYSRQDSMVYSQDYLSGDICIIPQKEQSEPEEEMTAGAALCVDDTDNRMLYSQNIYEKMYPASITKIVTALITLKYGNLKDTVTISYDASHITEYGAKLCGFQEGDQINLKDLLTCLLIYSGNDAGVGIAEHIAGSVDAFADMMNREMDFLGASGSHFVNPHGLHDKKHYTTAYDLYLVFHELLKYEEFVEILQQPEITVEYKNQQGEKQSSRFTATNQYLIGYSQAPEGVTVMGGKTGTTTEAGSCLILYSQDSEGKDYISVVLKADSSYSLYRQMNHLLEKTVASQAPEGSPAPEGSSTPEGSPAPKSPTPEGSPTPQSSPTPQATETPAST